jgi:putative ABC transport system permease protein
MNLWFDIKYAFRVLAKSWTHAVLCVCVVALSVGLATFVYAIAYGAFLRPLNVPNADRWYVLHAAPNSTEVPSVLSLDAFTYQELVKAARTVKHLGAVSMRNGVLSEDTTSVNLRAFAITPGLLAATQVRPQLGRVFTSDDSEGTAVILSFDTWQSYFAGDPGIVGKQARINGEPLRVVGVMPRSFSLGMQADLWIPMERTVLQPETLAGPVEPFILLGPNQTRDDALREMKGALDSINRAYPDRFNPGRRLALAPAHRAFTDAGSALPAILAVMAGGIATLGSMNIGMLFFARLRERSRELALRNAVGASRWSILRQCLLESSLVVLAGLGLGITLAVLAAAWTQNKFDYLTEGMQYANTADFLVTGRHLVVAIVAAIAIWLLSTLVPAWRVAQQDAAQVLAGGGKGVNSAGGAKTANILVGLQIMISCMVLVACANTVTQLYSTANKPMGFSTDGIVAPRIPVKLGGAYADLDTRLQYFDTLTANVKSRDAGADVAFATAVPGKETFTVRMAFEAHETLAVRDLPVLRVVAVSENYFDLLGIKLRSGRLFDSSDNASSSPVAVLDENFAQRYWPGQDPLGKRIQLSPVDNGPWVTVIGVVSHVGMASDAGAFRGKMYRPLRQAAAPEFVPLAKSPRPANATRAALIEAAFTADRDLPLGTVESLTEYFEKEKSGGIDYVFVGVGIITAFLAATGLLGLITRSVAQRVHEIGVRRAVGATPWQVTQLFLRQGAVHLVIGIVVGGGLGTLATVAIGRTTLFPGILDHVVLVTLCVFAGLAAVTLSASYFPTRRAVSVEPGDALRYE